MELSRRQDNGNSVDSPDSYVLYRYNPSLPAAIIFIICFSISTAIHMFQAWRRRTYYFIPLIIGGCCETIGYIGRALGHNNTFALGQFVMQSLLLLISPALFAASIYMILGRLILRTEATHLAPISPRWLTKIFVVGDVLSFSIQGGGGGLMANAPTFLSGEHMVVAGLLVQIVFFGVFVSAGVVFHRRIQKNPTSASTEMENGLGWRKYMYTLYAASALIFIRSIFRVVEFSTGNDSVFQRHEFFLYVFDSVLMLGVIALFNVVHPGLLIGRKANKERSGVVVVTDASEHETGLERLEPK